MIRHRDSSSNTTPRPLPNFSGRGYFSFSSPLGPMMSACSSSCWYDGSHGLISLRQCQRLFLQQPTHTHWYPFSISAARSQVHGFVSSLINHVPRMTGIRGPDCGQNTGWRESVWRSTSKSASWESAPIA